MPMPMKHIIRVLVPLLCVAVISTQAGGETWLLKAGKITTMTGEVFEPGAVLIKDGKVVEVAKSIEVSDEVRVADYPQSEVLPGLINASGQTGVDGGASEFTREITPNHQLQFSIDWRSRSFREALAGGVTTVNISPGTENVIAGASLVVKTVGKIDDRIIDDDNGLVVTMASDPRSRNSSRRRPDSIYVRQPTNRMGVVWMLRSTLDRIKQTPQAADVRLVEVINGKRTLYGVSRTHYDIAALLRVTDEFQIKPTVVGGQEAYKLADELAKRKVAVILHTLSTSGSSGPEGTDPVLNHAGPLHRAGVLFAFSGPQLLEQARFAVRFGLPPEAALRAITLSPAELLGIDGRVGSLAPGRDADMLVLSGDPFEFTTQIQAVIVDGVTYEESTHP